ncbi:tape measure protein [Alteromonas phage vB_AmeP_PT11-V19]|nr:tape measure protein [Alteromonas phage vB_AmeP_PT11-V19]
MADMTEEEVFNSDVDPMDGIRELRKQEAENSTEEPASEEPELEEETSEEMSEEPEQLPEEDEGSEDPELDQEEEQEQDDTSDENTDEEEEEPSETAGIDLTEVRKFKAAGQEYEFTVAEILEQFGTVLGKSVDYTQKTKAIAPYRKMISAIEEEGVTQEQLNVAIDALKGDKGAIKQLMETHGIDGYDLNSEESPYTPKEYGKDESLLQIEDVVKKISVDPEYQQTQTVVGSLWDKESQGEIANNPVMLEGLHNDIKEGIYSKVAPIAAKMRVLDGNTKSDLEYYKLAGQEYAKSLQSSANQVTDAKAAVDDLNRKTQAAVESAGRASSEATKKRSATSTKSRVDNKGVIDYLDDNDEAYDDWYNKLMSSN